MKCGVAFIRAVGMYGSRNDTRRQLERCLRDIEDDGNDASAGQRIERQLEECFNEPFSVTTRSIQRVRRMASIEMKSLSLNMRWPLADPSRESHDTD